MFKKKEKRILSDAKNTFDKIQPLFMIFKITRKHSLNLIEGHLTQRKSAHQPTYRRQHS